MLTGGFLESTFFWVFSRILANHLIWHRLFSLGFSVFICKMEIVHLQDCCGIKYDDVYRISGSSDVCSFPSQRGEMENSSPRIVYFL